MARTSGAGWQTAVHHQGRSGPTNHVTLEGLLPVESEVVVDAEDHDLIVHTLTGQPLAWNRHNRYTKQI